MAVKLELYRVFKEVAETGNISAAAKNLYISQSAVSQSIKQLETALQARLFARSPRGVTLTGEGQMLYQYVRNALGLLATGEDKLSQAQQLLLGTLTIGASDTDNGVTVTADAILFDGYNYLISYTLEKEDGSAFDCTKNPDTGLLNVYWNRADSNIGLNAQGAIGSSYFYDENPNDNAIQYVETMSYTDAVTTGGTAKIMLGDLTAVTDNGAETKTIADGTWHLKFKLEADNSAVELPAGQSIQVGGKTATINKVLLSPIGYNFVYTVDGKAPFENAESGQEPASHRDTWDAFSAKLLINKKDGTVIDVPGNGSSMDPHDGKTVCTRQGTFDTILPLDEVASVTIGDTTIPVK